MVIFCLDYDKIKRKQGESLMVFPKSIYFRGQWRRYQQRVLDHSSQYMKDGHMHVIAAPGSGKTTLGIELVLRQQSFSLILTPSLTIRQQWIQRFVDHFLDDEEKKEQWISTSLKQIRPFTVITYQALFSAYKKQVSVDVDEGWNETEDFRYFDCATILKENNVECFCLDEAHHLRNEWYLALSAIKEAVAPSMVISLTATPPLDSTEREWFRYLELCGEIDEEIYIPELVKDQNLCPHQDYVYLSYPSAEERKQLHDFRNKAYEIAKELIENNQFSEAICTHPGIVHLESSTEIFLEYPTYFSALIQFWRNSGIQLNEDLQQLCDETKSLGFSMKHLEEVLQGFLYFDVDSYLGYEELQKKILGSLKARGFLFQRKVTLVQSQHLEKVLMNSTGKLESIHKISRCESKRLQDQLRLLILTDNIASEDLELKQDQEVIRLGAGSVFEYLRRYLKEERSFALLSGQVVVLPMACAEIIGKLEPQLRFELHPLSDCGYGKLILKKALARQEVALVTKLFELGYIRILIGTKSLLGEGWDAPCINALILASNVGTTITSNQMRGRAIRIDRNNPEKTANIWHLAAVKPPVEPQTIWGKIMNETEPVQSNDLEMLRRRFRTYLGLHYSNDTIESGWQRIILMPEDYTEEQIERSNRLTMLLSIDRGSLYQRWMNAVARLEAIDDVSDYVQVDETKLIRPVHYNQAVIQTSAGFLVSFLCFVGTAFTLAELPLATGLGLLGSYSLFLQRKKINYIQSFTRQRNQLQYFAKCLLKALQHCGMIQPQALLILEQKKQPLGYLTSVTTKQKELFSRCLEEMLGPVNNPRYLICYQKGRKQTCYMSVPEILGQQKSNAMQLIQQLNEFHLDFQLLFTRTKEGRKILLKARVQSEKQQSTIIIGKNKKMTV